MCPGHSRAKRGLFRPRIRIKQNANGKAVAGDHTSGRVALTRLASRPNAARLRIADNATLPDTAARYFDGIRTDSAFAMFCQRVALTTTCRPRAKPKSRGRWERPARIRSPTLRPRGGTLGGAGNRRVGSTNLRHDSLRRGEVLFSVDLRRR